jgi:DNA-binding NarL/FixJ family response regulator
MVNAMPPLAESVSEPRSELRPIRLLIVDDSPKVLAVLRCLLAEQPGLVVSGCFASAELALDVARAVRPDAVLLDVRMPGMGGLAAVPHFKRLQPSPVVLLMTMNDDIGVRREAERAGADALMAKTDIEGETLRVVLHALMALK